MELHLNRVDRSLEELTKKVQKHTSKTPEIINIDTPKNENKGFKWNILLKPPYIFMIVLPLVFIILLMYFKPSIILELDPKDPLQQTKYINVQKLLIWSVVLSCICGACIYYFLYMKKTENEETTNLNDKKE